MSVLSVCLSRTTMCFAAETSAPGLKSHVSLPFSLSFSTYLPVTCWLLNPHSFWTVCPHVSPSMQQSSLVCLPVINSVIILKVISQNRFML